MALKDLRVGIVGLGDAGQLHFDNWSRTPGVRVLALCDVRSETAVQLTGSAAPFYYDAEDMFDSVELDAISLCTPTASHHPIGEMALARGISLLCEMPATPNSRLTEELIRTHGRALPACLPVPESWRSAARQGSDGGRRHR